MTTFGPMLRRVRQSRRMSQSKLARRAGVSPGYISRLESSNRISSRNVLDRIVTALQLAPDDADALVATAGFLPSTPTAPITTDLDCLDLIAYLGDAGIPAQRREAVRIAVRGILDLVIGDADAI